MVGVKGGGNPWRRRCQVHRLWSSSRAGGRTASLRASYAPLKSTHQHTPMRLHTYAHLRRLPLRLALCGAARMRATRSEGIESACARVRTPSLPSASKPEGLTCHQGTSEGGLNEQGVGIGQASAESWMSKRLERVRGVRASGGQLRERETSRQRPGMNGLRRRA